ncbi:ABC transporter substrate-binding protein [Nocardioides alcanivorans]|uniref:ABC transporter substrate-binding protein n=1 Tax=Nocardioides alcanivorans TaxID=2897352 RepID=UPI001F281446|nr:ABC transporter substrate-binding protein [Nocardioides alcanivorans]
MSTRRTAVAAALSALVLTGCGLANGSDDEQAVEGDNFPVTVENCGADVTFNRAPERVVMLKSAAVPFLAELGVLDRVNARGGEYPREYYDDETWEQLNEIPALTGKTDSGGHLLISKEVVIEEEPDLVLGEVDNLNRDTLASAKIPLLEEPAMCAQGIDDPGYDDVVSQLRLYGEVFDKSEEADAAAQEIEAKVAELSATAEGEQRSAAVLFPTIGGGTTYAYGSKSMAQPQLEAAGFDNVFGDAHERVFEVTLEELLDRDPDVIILLHSTGTSADVTKALTDLPGSSSLAAVRNDAVMPLLFNFVEPPSPLSVRGLEMILERFGESR